MKDNINLKWSKLTGLRLRTLWCLGPRTPCRRKWLAHASSTFHVAMASTVNVEPIDFSLARCVADLCPSVFLVMVYALHHPKKPKNCALDSTISPSIQYQKYPKIIHEKSLKNRSPPTSKLDISRVASLRRLGGHPSKMGGGGRLTVL